MVAVFACKGGRGIYTLSYRADQGGAPQLFQQTRREDDVVCDVFRFDKG